MSGNKPQCSPIPTNAVLRDLTERDIPDRIRWLTEETAWGDWDAPDKPMEPIDPQICRAELLKAVREAAAKPDSEHRWQFEVDADGVHIGRVNTYCIDADYRWVKNGKRNALGIDICESSYWNRGLGRQILATLIQYHLDDGIRELYLQTWSGNLRMIHVAALLGFAECNRIIGNRAVRGGVYDTITFRLNFEKFGQYLRDSV
ncbi:MAG: GNAT family N-acetyltransferase [Clostridiales bacterium]|nr:GNAT family N-acetyltransferase [Clostridiales bacterium]